MPQISVIVPVYNVQAYLHQCVDSLLLQTFRDIEVLLIDDGSKDGSGAICDDYAAKDDRVKVIHKVNGGVSAARNTGLEHAGGDYVLFCDSDDYVQPEWCEHLLHQVKAHPNSWCFCGCHCVDAQARMLEENCVFHATPMYETLPITEYRQVYETNYSALLWNRIFEMRIIREHQLRFDEQMSVSEDVLFNLEYGRYCDQFAIVNLALYNHRVYVDDEVEHLDGKLPAEMFYINRRIYLARKPFIAPEQMTAFETDYFYRFIDDMKQIAQRTDFTKTEKLRKLRGVLKSKEFRTTLCKGDTSKEHWKLLLLLKWRLTTMVLSQFEGT